LGPTAKVRLAARKLYFLLSPRAGVAGKPKLVALTCLNGVTVTTPGEPADLPPGIATNGNPVVDSAGNLMFWANDTLYGFTSEPKLLFAARPALSEPNPQLLFGPGGTLYWASEGVNSFTVSALVPSFNLKGNTGVTGIYSPTQLRVTGEAATGKMLTLETLGSMTLDKGFAVKTGTGLTVRVNVRK
jgi:hypothetical protein